MRGVGKTISTKAPVDRTSAINSNLTSGRTSCPSPAASTFETASSLGKATSSISPMSVEAGVRDGECSVEVSVVYSASESGELGCRPNDKGIECERIRTDHSCFLEKRDSVLLRSSGSVKSWRIVQYCELNCQIARVAVGVTYDSIINWAVLSV